jgi:hypothetical protein
VGFFGIDDRPCTRLLVLAPLVASGFALSGCMSSPTYGTDKTATEQLVDDLNNAVSLAPTRREPIDYKPRPPLVKPAPGEKETLPPPQEDITRTASAEWPESPEQRRARLRAYATEHRDDPNFDPQIENDIGGVPIVPRSYSDKKNSSPFTYQREAARQRAEVKRRLAENKQGDPTTRKYLSEPPLTYRQAADTAPQNDIGEDEAVKERRLKKQAQGKKGLFDWWPW